MWWNTHIRFRLLQSKVSDIILTPINRIDEIWDRSLDHFSFADKTEKYLLLPKYQRSLIARLRSGTLSIETGRFTNVLLENRTCILCNNEEIEDEIHFLCVCPQLELIRQKYYETYNNLKSGFSNLNNESKFLYMNKNHFQILW